MKKVILFLLLCVLAIFGVHRNQCSGERRVPGVDIAVSTQGFLIGGGITIGRCGETGPCYNLQPGQGFTGCCGETEETCRLCDGDVAHIKQNEFCFEFGFEGDECDVDMDTIEHQPCFDLMVCEWYPYPFPPGGDCVAVVSTSWGSWFYCVRIT